MHATSSASTAAIDLRSPAPVDRDDGPPRPIQRVGNVAAAYATPGYTATIARHWAANPAAWLDLVVFEDGARRFAPLVSNRWISVWLITWAPGTGVPFHDHGEAAGSFAVARGLLEEDHISPLATHKPSSRLLEAGEVVSFPAGHIHAVRNITDRPAVSIHAYVPQLTGMGFYDIGAGRKPKLAHSERVDPERRREAVAPTYTRSGPRWRG